ncbi:MAG: hypothetical protein ABSH03_19905 [Candidatus Lustribacter sp.]
MERITPLIGPTVEGPLGVKMLPRTWLKSVLSAAGLLPEGYFDNDKGFNHRVVDVLGLEPEAFFGYLATMPTYPQAEEYVRKNAKRLDPATIAALNDGIVTYDRPEEAAAAVRALTGISDASVRNSQLLLCYDDWHALHTTLVAHRAEGIEPQVPMVSSGQVGLAGIPHLPRMWIKALLNAVGALHPEWKTGTVCGFDKKIAETIGLDLVAAVAYVNAELPNYLQFEGWVLDHIPKPDAATKAAWVSSVAAMQKTEDMAAAECKECGVAGAGLRGTVLLNDMVDWKYMHDRVAGSRAAGVA